MNKGLSPPKRLYLLFIVVFLASTVSFMAISWPQRDAGVIADLGAPECREWRELPDGVFPDRYPEADKPCFSIRSLNFHEHVILRSEDDYERYLTGQRARMALTSLAGWAALSAGVYLLGRLSLWARGTLPKWGEPKAR